MRIGFYLRDAADGEAPRAPANAAFMIAAPQKDIGIGTNGVSDPDLAAPTSKRTPRRLHLNRILVVVLFVVVRFAVFVVGRVADRHLVLVVVIVARTTRQSEAPCVRRLRRRT